MIPRYALGIWWNKNDFYYFDDIQKLLNGFNRYKIPLSVLLLGDNWHLKDKNNLKDLILVLHLIENYSLNLAEFN